MPLTLNFDNEAATRIDACGGKGANLSILTQRGFPVPPGFVVTGEVYRAFIEQASGLLENLDQLPFGDPQAMRVASGRIQSAMSGLALPAGALEEIGGRIAGYPAGSAFSVRSSSTMEDLAGAAFAGQHETYLNVVGAGEVAGRVRDCFVSLWADRAIAYRHQQGFDHGEAVMAVVVQLSL